MQKTKIMLGLALAVLSVAVCAAQSSPTMSQQGASSAQTAPQAPGAATTPQAQPAQPPSHAKTVDDELQLTPDQKQKIQGVIDDENKQMGAIREDSSLTPEQKQQKAMSVRQEGATKIKAVLSPEQLQKLAALQERARQQQSTSPSSPQ
jgi:hypothetical protein